MKNVVYTVIIILVGLFVWGAVLTALDDNDQVTSEAKGNTSKYAFISGCKQESIKVPGFTDETAQSYCECAYDSLLELYPDFNDNEARDNRILTEGYNQTETDVMVKCYPEELIQ